MAIVSQSPLFPTGQRIPGGGGPAVSVGTPISAIGISPTNDNIRLVGLVDGHVFGTVTGSPTMTDISPTLPNNPNASATIKYIARTVIDPNNPNIASVAPSYYAPAGQGIFKTTNLNNTGVG